MNPKKKTAKSKATKEDFKFCQDLIDRLVTAPKNWGLEISRAKALLKKHGKEVWDYVRLPRVIDSLLWFDTAAGKDCLEKARKTMAEMGPQQKVVDIDEEMEYSRVTEKQKSIKSRLFE